MGLPLYWIYGVSYLVTIPVNGGAQFIARFRQNCTFWSTNLACSICTELFETTLSIGLQVFTPNVPASLDAPLSHSSINLISDCRKDRNFEAAIFHEKNSCQNFFQVFIRYNLVTISQLCSGELAGLVAFCERIRRIQIEWRSWSLFERNTFWKVANLGAFFSGTPTTGCTKSYLFDLLKTTFIRFF